MADPQGIRDSRSSLIHVIRLCCFILFGILGVLKIGGFVGLGWVWVLAPLWVLELGMFLTVTCLVPFWIWQIYRDIRRGRL